MHPSIPLLSLAFMASPVLSETQTSEADLKKNYHCDGYARTGFIQTKLRSVETQSATAIAGKIGCGYRLNTHVSAYAAGYGVLDMGFNAHNDDNVHPDFFNAKKDSYLMLGEAFLTLEYEGFSAHLGRQIFDSPHLDSDDIRMVPNLVEAYLVDYEVSDALKIGAGFIRQMAGWENGVNQSHFVPIGEAFGGRNSGAWVSWLNYEQQQLNASAWLYIIPNHVAITYADIHYQAQLTEDITYSVGFQYDFGHSIGEARLGKLEAHTFGLLGTLSAKGLTFTAAYNKNFGKTGALSSAGAGPFFSALEDQTLDMASGKDAQSYLLGLDYSINEALNIGIAYGEVSARDKNDYQMQEINYFLNYNLKEQFKFEVVYAAIDDKNSTEGMDQLRAIFTYQF